MIRKVTRSAMRLHSVKVEISVEAKSAALKYGINVRHAAASNPRTVRVYPLRSDSSPARTPAIKTGARSRSATCFRRAAIVRLSTGGFLVFAFVDAMGPLGLSFIRS